MFFYFKQLAYWEMWYRRLHTDFKGGKTNKQTTIHTFNVNQWNLSSLCLA